MVVIPISGSRGSEDAEAGADCANDAPSMPIARPGSSNKPITKDLAETTAKPDFASLGDKPLRIDTFLFPDIGDISA
jgi:hypothetical protein